jgi:hypothetical protein
VPTGDRYILIFTTIDTHTFIDSNQDKIYDALHDKDKVMLAIRKGKRVNIITEIVQCFGAVYPNG